MSQAEMNRMKQDLAMIHQALGMEPLFGWADVWYMLTWVAIGVSLALLGYLRLSVLGVASAGRMIAGGIILIYFLLMSAWLRGRKGNLPARWRETRVGLISAVLVVAALLPFSIWAKRHGLSFEAITATLIFVGGLAILIISICDRSRLHYIGVALPMLILGPLFPTIVVRQHRLDQSQVDLFIGLFYASIGALSALIMTWQLRRPSNG